MREHDPLQALQFAIDKYPEKVEAVPLDRVVTETARANDKRPAWAKVLLPDDLVKGLRGGGDHDLVLLVRVPREVLARAESKIILPGEVK